MNVKLSNFFLFKIKTLDSNSKICTRPKDIKESLGQYQGHIFDK